MRPETRIYNGANDNASGVSALIEIARAMAAAPVKPRRSVVFIAYFGEERGLVGSRYYARHPVFPIDKTYAQVNLEQLGRTDDVGRSASESRNAHRMGSLGCGHNPGGRREAAGIRIYKHEKYSEEFFDAAITRRWRNWEFPRTPQRRVRIPRLSRAWR